ncbi:MULTISPECIES: two-component sensor histidine kinase BarA [Yersinia pseudotuberculosis complex]|uniref:histidine kinase n=1 Tax=Yersinia pseudotuberculosis serotype O:1b (strain IP 31758) TaxID=349747 RepID=A0A0U1QU98_YERP3|nr:MULTISPECIES: two-component sensor histidine kinase BarA [Yersinia pseudotuberculosis complex]ABS45993.1 signal transduction histidine-protein kinase BarA [Yersinia pseudotuberculosis IP 31758]AJK17615.1 HAMP domain protein [Yersinia pseudotuberculosis str. PA3606]MCE4111591.1 two-component sensor histidine kinase BarA [Yersinia pseudotuberculosis]MCF1161692.1 two-component sensor histidine kinase BarA [Yersinia pseudotuberculosis]UFA63017.1 Signal transduction histidine-protein kinase BarA
MTKYSLRARMMILILAPTLLLGLLLSTSFMVNRYNELQNQIVSAGTNIIEPLAVASEYGMSFRNRDTVRQLINLLHRRHSNIVRSISVFDVDNKLFVTSNYNYNSSQLRLPPGEPVPDSLMLSYRGDSLILRMPIVSESNLSSEQASGQGESDQILGYIAIDLDLQSVRLKQYKEIFISTLLLLFCMCVAILFAYRLMRDVTGPIRNMVNTVDRIRRGQLDSRVEGHMLGELNILKNGINSMAMSLAAYHEEMQQNIDQATSDLRETLEQMEIQNVELGLAKKRAQEASRIKSEFLANMSHELRTPLNGVIGFTRQTLKTSLTPTQTDYLQTIQRSANNLLCIINDVLDFSKLEADKLILEHIPFSLRGTLDEVIILLAHTAHEKGLELTLHINNDVPDQVLGDAMRLQQIVTNLLGNAIKFTEEGNIDILVVVKAIASQQVTLMVEIHDTGIGISESQQAQLFQAFRQADASTSRRHGGTGLGLVITERLVKEMGGNISFQSQMSCGSIFRFHLTLELNESIPYRQPDMAHLEGKQLAYIERNSTAARATINILNTTPLQVTHRQSLAQLPEQHYDFLLVGVPIPFRNNMAIHQDKLLTALKIADHVILALPSQSQVEAEQLKQIGAKGCLLKPISSIRLIPLLLAEDTHSKVPSEEQPRKQPKLPFRVMAVDDNPANLKLIGTLLEEQIEETVLCDSGAMAITYAREHTLDIILMDIQMPEIDGIRASEIIHQIPHHQETPIIAVTAHAVKGQQEQLLRLGMADYLAKPIDEARLLQVLSRYQSDNSPLSTASTTSTTSTASTAESLPLPVPKGAGVIDWAQAVRQAANKEDLARDLLTMLLEFMPQITARVQAILAGADDGDILNLVHKFHGSCACSGVPRLRQLCMTIELQLRQQVNLQDLEPEWLELLDEIENVSEAAKTYLRTE